MRRRAAAVRQRLERMGRGRASGAGRWFTAIAGWRRCATRCAAKAVGADGATARRPSSRSPSSATRSRRSAWASSCAATCRPARPRAAAPPACSTSSATPQRADPAHFAADRRRASAAICAGRHPHLPHQRRRGGAGDPGVRGARRFLYHNIPYTYYCMAQNIHSLYLWLC